MRKGRCIDCSSFLHDNKDPRKCHCTAKESYETKNALRVLACNEFNPDPDAIFLVYHCDYCGYAEIISTGHLSKCPNNKCKGTKRIRRIK